MNIKTSNIIGLKELRENMETYINRVANGESLTILRRSTPIFKISPADEEESMWETVIDFTTERPEGIPISELLASMKSFKS